MLRSQPFNVLHFKFSVKLEILENHRKQSKKKIKIFFKLIKSIVFAFFLFQLFII